MQTIKISVTGAQATVTQAPVLTCGMAGLPVELTFDDSWEGLQKTLVCRVGEQTRAQFPVTQTGTVPADLLTQPHRQLEIGVYGASQENQLVIPTVWVKVGLIQESADPYADPNLDPQLPVWQQLMDRIAKLDEQIPMLQELSDRVSELEEPQLLWEMVVPSREENPSLRLGWDSAWDISFKDRPWNDLWYEDPSLPANTTFKEKVQHMLDILEDIHGGILEFSIEDVVQIRTHTMLFQVNSDGGPKIIMLAMDPTYGSTDPCEMYMGTLTAQELRFGFSVGQDAETHGWSLRLWR